MRSKKVLEQEAELNEQRATLISFYSNRDEAIDKDNQK